MAAELTRGTGIVKAYCMEGNGWELFGITSKWLSLVAMAAVIGGGFTLGLANWLNFSRLAAIANYMLAGAVIGLCMTLLFFLLQVGAINRTGVTGMLDKQMGLILLQSNVGSAAVLRMAGFVCAGMGYYFLRLGTNTSGTGWLTLRNAGFTVLAAAIVLLGISFAVTGHTSTLSTLAHTAIILHVLAAFLWIGSLYPLLYLSGAAELTKVARLMFCFGSSALLIVAVLVASGIFLLTQLLQSISELLSTDYGLIVLFKLGGVTVLLSLAGINKLLLVPRLVKTNSARLLQTSIRMEIGFALLILAVTAGLTTVVGPPKL